MGSSCWIVLRLPSCAQLTASLKTRHDDIVLAAFLKVLRLLSSAQLTARSLKTRHDDIFLAASLKVQHSRVQNRLLPYIIHCSCVVFSLAFTLQTYVSHQEVLLINYIFWFWVRVKVNIKCKQDCIHTLYTVLQNLKCNSKEKCLNAASLYFGTSTSCWLQLQLWYFLTDAMPYAIFSYWSPDNLHWFHLSFVCLLYTLSSAWAQF